MTLLSHVDIIARQISIAGAVLAQVIPDGSEVLLLDYPEFSNIGDSLIWLGQMTYLRSRNMEPRYICSSKNYSAHTMRRVIKPNTVVLLSGGGNFGTLYPHHQQLRDRLLKDFPQTAVVQLSQSICFDDQGSLDAVRRSIAAHRNVTLLARDESALEFSEKWFECKTQLCPDMAFFLGPLTPDQPRFDLLGLCRDDKESSGLLAAALQSVSGEKTLHVTDWLRGLSKTEETYTRTIRRLRRPLSHLDPRNRLLAILWNRLASARLQRGIQLLSLGRIVVTDRLHGHILALLLGRPHIVMDNSNNKVSSFYRTWTQDSPITRLCNSTEQLAAALHDS